MSSMLQNNIKIILVFLHRFVHHLQLKELEQQVLQDQLNSRRRKGGPGVLPGTGPAARSVGGGPGAPQKLFFLWTFGKSLPVKRV